MMLRRRGASTIHVTLACVLSLGLLVLAYFAGTATCEGPLEPGALSDSDGGSRRDRDAYGFVAVDLANPLDSKRLLNPPSDVIDRDALAIEQHTQADLMTSRSTLEAVLSNPALTLRKTKWFSSFKHPIQAQRWLERHFHAVPVRGSKLIEVWIDPIDSSHEARTIVMDIVNTYLDDQRKIHQTRTLDRQSSLNTLKIKYENRIRELADRRNNLLLRLNVIGAGSTSLTTSIEIEFNHAVANAAAANATLDAAQSAYERVIAELSGDKSVPKGERDQEIRQLRGQLAELEQEIRSTSATTRNSKPIREAQLKHEALSERVRALSEEAIVEARTARVSQAESAMRTAQATAAAAQKRVESLRGVLADVSIAMSDLISTQEELARTRVAANEVRDELDTIQSMNLRMPVEWARYPTARDESD